MQGTRLGMDTRPGVGTYGREKSEIVSEPEAQAQKQRSTYQPPGSVLARRVTRGTTHEDQIDPGPSSLRSLTFRTTEASLVNIRVCLHERSVRRPPLGRA